MAGGIPNLDFLNTNPFIPQQQDPRMGPGMNHPYASNQHSFGPFMDLAYGMARPTEHAQPGYPQTTRPQYPQFPVFGGGGNPFLGGGAGMGGGGAAPRPDIGWGGPRRVF